LLHSLKNVHIFYQNSIFVAEAQSHVYMKESSATKHRAFGIRMS